MAGWLTDPGPKGERTEDGRTVHVTPDLSLKPINSDGDCGCGCNQTAQNCPNRAK